MRQEEVRCAPRSHSGGLGSTILDDVDEVTPQVEGGKQRSAMVGDAKGRRQRRTPVFEEFEDI